MPETSWEKQTKSNTKTRLLVWLIIALLLVAAAGFIIYNNRDVISGKAGTESGSASFSVKEPVDTTASVQKPAEEKAPSPAIEQAKKDSAPAPVKVAEAKPVPRVEKKHAAAPPAAGTFKPRAAATIPAAAEPASLGIDSVEINDVLCSVLNRTDIKVRLSMTACCVPARKREVLIKRDALAVVTKKLLSTKDLEEVKIGSMKGELIQAMNALFESRVITDVVLRSVDIEKVSLK